MNIDLTRHGGYELGLTLWFYISVALVFLASSIIGAVIALCVKEWNGGTYSRKQRIENAKFASIAAPFVAFIPIVAIIFSMGCAPMGQMVGEIRSKPYTTNSWQVSKKVPSSKVTFMLQDEASTMNVETVTSPQEGSDYANRIWDSVSKHYAVDLISMKIHGVSYSSDPMAVLLKEEKSGAVRNCQLNVGKVNKISQDGVEYVKSFDGYLICQGSEAPKR